MTSSTDMDSDLHSFYDICSKILQNQIEMRSLRPYFLCCKLVKYDIVCFMKRAAAGRRLSLFVKLCQPCMNPKHLQYF